MEGGELKVTLAGYSQLVTGSWKGPILTSSKHNCQKMSLCKKKTNEQGIFRAIIKIILDKKVGISQVLSRHPPTCERVAYFKCL